MYFCVCAVRELIFQLQIKDHKNMMSFKTLNILFLLLVLFIPVKAQTKIQSGSWSVNQSVPGYSLDKNNGERSVTIEIRFEKPFISKPQIFLTATQVDANKEANLRYKIEAISISRDGFTMKVNTWADSKIFSISGCWLAKSE